MSQHELIVDGKPRAKHFVVLAHGAGAPMDSEFMNIVAAGLAAAGIRVVRFEFPYMAERRKTGKRSGPNPAKRLMTAYREVLEQIGKPERLVIGGKSMGGRIASMIADDVGVRGLVCLGYPFHPPGQPAKLRTAHLAELQTPTLIVQGERDTFGTRQEVAGYTLAPQIAFAWLPDGDHSFKPRVRSGHTLADNLDRCIASVAEFVLRP